MSRKKSEASGSQIAISQKLPNFKWSILVLLLTISVALATFGGNHQVSAATGAGSLYCPSLSPYTNNHDYILAVGSTVTCYLIGATDASGSPINVIIKNSDTLNTTVSGTSAACPAPYSASSSCYQFTFTAPLASCNTGPVSYVSNGNNANDDIVDDGVITGTGLQPSGFAYYDSSGALKTTCGSGTPQTVLTVSKTADTSYVRNCTWDISKSADKTSIVVGDAGGSVNYSVSWVKSCVDSGFTVSGVITVTNDGTEDATVTNVTDNLPGAVVSGCPAFPAVLAPGASLNCNYTASVASAASGTNTATATSTGTPSSFTSDPPTPYSFGDPTTINGNCATITDTAPGFAPIPTCASGSAPTYTRNFTNTSCARETIDNTATVTPSSGAVDTASVTVTVDKLCLSVSKTASTTYDRTCGWTIDKSGPASVRVPDGGTGTITYTIKATGTCTDGNFRINGNITVTNTGSVTATVNVADNKGSVTCPGGLPATVAAAGTLNCTYAGTLTSNAAGINTAAARGSASGAQTSAQGTAPYDFNHGPANTVGDCATVSDPQLTPNPLGTPCVPNAKTSTTTPAPYTVTYNPTKTVAWNAQTCLSTIDNTATVTWLPSGTASDSHSVAVVCLGKTMGFWGNRNGNARLTPWFTAANSVTLGNPGPRISSVIDTLTESNKVMPNTLDACGSAGPVIYTPSPCTLATGLNLNSLNVLSAQTLALSYNIGVIGAPYATNTIGDLSCTPVGTLTTSSSVGAALVEANKLIGQSASGGTTTQSAAGAMNTLLGCLNSES